MYMYKSIELAWKVFSSLSSMYMCCENDYWRVVNLPIDLHLLSSEETRQLLKMKLASVFMALMLLLAGYTQKYVF